MPDSKDLDYSSSDVRPRSASAYTAPRKGTLPAQLLDLAIGESVAVARRIDKGDMPFYNHAGIAAMLASSLSSAVTRLHQTTDHRFKLERGSFFTDSGDVMVCLVATRIDPNAVADDGLDDTFNARCLDHPNL